jgi:2-polyprenyl-6-methoxyphenol hydroxylase-like FAD-dependent oxidoreductase
VSPPGRPKGEYRSAPHEASLVSDAVRVLVAGAGPVGLTVALALADAGVAVTVLEKRDALSAASKASTFHPPTLAILHHLDVLDDVLARGTIVERIQYRTTTGGIFAEFALETLRAETRFPFRLHLEQAAVTPVMLERLQRHRHAEVIFDAEVIGVESMASSVAVRVRHRGREHSLAGAWLVGADGSRSQVRAALGIAFEGDDYPDKILRVMTDEQLDLALPGIAPLTYLFNAARSVSFLRMSDCWRIILRVPKDIDDEHALAPEWIHARLAAISPAFERLPNIVMKDIYGVARRVAARYHVGRTLLVGDSAHVTNTRGGMNMNCGIHDAFAIARAIVAARTQGKPELVTAAADLRRRIATDFLIPRTDRNVAGGQAWLDTVKEMAARADKALAYLRTTAMLDMVPDPDDPLYRPDPVTLAA